MCTGTQGETASRVTSDGVSKATARLAMQRRGATALSRDALLRRILGRGPGEVVTHKATGPQPQPMEKASESLMAQMEKVLRQGLSGRRSPLHVGARCRCVPFWPRPVGLRCVYTGRVTHCVPAYVNRRPN